MHICIHMYVLYICTDNNPYLRLVLFTEKDWLILSFLLDPTAVYDICDSNSCQHKHWE